MLLEGHRVIMTGRDEQRGRDALQALRAEDAALAERLYGHDNMRQEAFLTNTETFTALMCQTHTQFTL